MIYRQSIFLSVTNDILATNDISTMMLATKEASIANDVSATNGVLVINDKLPTKDMSTIMIF